MADEVTIVVRAEDNFSGVLGNFGNIMTGIKSAIDLAGDAFRFFKDYALEGLNAIATFERLGLALETLSASQALQAGTASTMEEALRLTSGEAERLLTWMQELAIKSPFTLEGVANAFRLAQAYGFSADEAQRLTQAMIDFAAGTGASEQVMSQIALALGQIEAKGKLAGQEVLQLVNAGLPVTQILADAFGVTTAEIEKMREQGLIPAQDAIEAITVYLETNFAGAAERQATTWAGLQGTFADIKQMGLREFFGGMFEVLQPLAISLSEFLQGEGLDRLREMGQVLGEITSALIQSGNQIQSMDFSDLMQSFSEWVSTVDWSQISNDISDAISSIDWGALGNDIAEGLGYLAIAIGEIISEIDWTTLLGSIGTAILDLIAGLFGNVNWDAMIADAKVGFEYVGRSIIDALRYAVNESWNNWVAIFSFGWDDLIRIVKNKLGISSPSTVFMSIARNIVQGLIDGWNTLFDTFLDLVGAGIEAILELFAPFLALFGVDIGSVTGGGTTGGGTNTGPGGETSPTSGQVVNNYFYGTVYIGSSLDDANYDCPSPNPLVAASANQLVTTGY